MAAIPRETVTLIQEFIELAKQDFAIERVFLFGSYASGKQKTDSDIDLAIISPDFRQEDCISNMTRLLCRADELNADIQSIPFSPAEYAEPMGLMEEILRTGIEFQIA